MKRTARAVTPPQPMQKPSRATTSGTWRAIWWSMDHCIMCIAARSLFQGCTVCAANAARRTGSWSMPTAPVVSTATQRKKNTMLPAVRRSTGTTSNQIASAALTDSVGSAMNRLGLASSHRSTWRSSARTCCATRPTASVASIRPPITATWLAHLASR